MAKLHSILLLCLIFAGQVIAAEMTVKGQGQAVIIDNQVHSARSLAGKAAKVNAIEKALKRFIREGTVDERNYFQQKAKLLKPPFPYLLTSKTLAEKRQSDLLFIEVAVVIDRDALLQHLGKKGLLASRVQDRNRSLFPSLMVIASEQISGTPNFQPYSSRIIADQLTAADYQVVDQSQVRRSIKHDQAVQAVLRADARSAQAMALQFEAGVLVTVKAVASRGGIKAGGMYPHMANVTLQAIEADSGRLLASGEGASSFPHIDLVTGSRRALEAASAKAAADLIQALQQAEQSTHNRLVVNINNINYAQAVTLKKILKRDFKRIDQINQIGFVGNTAKYELELFGGRQDFVDKLALHKFPSFRLKVLSYSAHKVDLELQMKN